MIPKTEKNLESSCIWHIFSGLKKIEKRFIPWGAQIISMTTVFIAMKSDFVYDEFGTSRRWRRSSSWWRRSSWKWSVWSLKNSPYFLTCFRTAPLSGFKYSILRKLRFIGMCRMRDACLTKYMVLRWGTQVFCAYVTKSKILAEKSQLKIIRYEDRNRKTVGYCKKCCTISRTYVPYSNRYSPIKKQGKKFPKNLFDFIGSSTFAPAFEREWRWST